MKKEHADETRNKVDMFIVLLYCLKKYFIQQQNTTRVNNHGLDVKFGRLERRVNTLVCILPKRNHCYTPGEVGISTSMLYFQVLH